MAIKTFSRGSVLTWEYRWGMTLTDGARAQASWQGRQGGQRQRWHERTGRTPLAPPMRRHRNLRVRLIETKRPTIGFREPWTSLINKITVYNSPRPNPNRTLVICHTKRIPTSSRPTVLKVLLKEITIRDRWSLTTALVYNSSTIAIMRMH